MAHRQPRPQGLLSFQYVGGSASAGHHHLESREAPGDEVGPSGSHLAVMPQLVGALCATRHEEDE